MSRDAEAVRHWWRTSIIDMKPGHIALRGHPIQDLIGNVSFGQMIWLMTRGDLPGPAGATAEMNGSTQASRSPIIGLARTGRKSAPKHTRPHRKSLH